MRANHLPTLDAELLPLLQRFCRLRVMTSAQAHRLFDGFAPFTERNARKRLRTLVKNGFLRADLAEPTRGAFGRFYYRLTWTGLKAVGRVEERYLAVAPAPHILRYLLFRNDVYAAAKSSGWAIASPVFTPAMSHDGALRTFNRWVQESKAATLLEMEEGGAPRADVLRARQELERLPRFLPTTLQFEYLVQFEARKVKDLVLLVIDDPRRSVEKQVIELPTVPIAGLRILLRDAESRFDLATNSLIQASPRLRRWRAALKERLGEEVALATELFPDVWAHRVNGSSAVQFNP